MRKTVFLFIVLTTLFFTLSYLIKSKFYFLPYQNSVEFFFAIVLMIITISMIASRKGNRKATALIGVLSTSTLIITISAFNYFMEWHPLQLSYSSVRHQSMEVDHEPYIWPIGSLDKFGFSSNSFNEYFEKLANWKRLKALLVIKNDTLLVEQYFSGATGHSAFNVHSITKSITSALVGIALQKKLIPSEIDPAIHYFPEYKKLLGNSSKDSITIQHLLSMRAGFIGNETFQTVEECFLEEEVNVPGKNFHYFTGSQEIISAIITKQSGKSLRDFCNEHLFKDLGIKEGFWRRIGPYYAGGDETYFTARDLARFGSLYLHKGKIESNQLLDSEWVEKSFTNYSQSPEFRNLESYKEIGYGYCWWLLEDNEGTAMYATRGRGGQHILLIPDKNIIVVILQETSFSKNPKVENQLIGELLRLL